MAKVNKEVVATKAAKIKSDVEAFLASNSFKSGEFELNLNYNPWWASQPKGDAFTYSLKGKNNQLSMSLQELSALKAFLNSVKLME